MTVPQPPAPPAPPPARPAAGASAAAVIDGLDVQAVAAAAAGCAGVSGLNDGQYGEVASYLPGLRVPGVQVRKDSVLVQVRSRWGVPAADLLRQIAAAVGPVSRGRRVDVVVGDIDDPPGPQADAGASPPGAPGASVSNPQP